MKGLSRLLLAACLAALPPVFLSPCASSDEGGDSAPAVIRPGGIGTIQRIGKEVMVIDDRSYSVSSATQYRTAAGESTWKESFRQGDRVLFELGAEGDVLLLWKLD